MKKRIIVTAAITACLALCAAVCATVWPQAETVKETPLPSEMTAVYAPKATVEELKTEAKTASLTEKEKAEIPQQEQTQEATPEPESAPVETSAVPEVQPTPEPAPVPEVSCGPAPEQATEPPAVQTTTEPPSGDMVYVEGFGWIENQGPNHVEYAEDMYENGNKIGIMGWPQKLRHINNEITAEASKNTFAVSFVSRQSKIFSLKLKYQI